MPCDYEEIEEDIKVDAQTGTQPTCRNAKDWGLLIDVNGLKNALIEWRKTMAYPGHLRGTTFYRLTTERHVIDYFEYYWQSYQQALPNVGREGVQFKLVYDSIVPCTLPESQQMYSLCEPGLGLNTRRGLQYGGKWNPCASGQALVEVTNNGKIFSGDGLAVRHTKVPPANIVEDKPNYKVEKTWGALTYVRHSHFANASLVHNIDKARCNRTRAREEGPRRRDEGWYMLKGLETGHFQFDLRHLPESLIYNEHYKIAIFARPSRCLYETCDPATRTPIAPVEMVPCRQPLELPAWFEDADVKDKRAVFNMSVFALGDVLVRIEFHITHGLWKAVEPFFYNTTTFSSTRPSRAIQIDGGTRWRDSPKFYAGLDNSGDAFLQASRRLSPFVSFEERWTEQYYFFGMVYYKDYAEDVAPPLNLPPRFMQYERGRVLLRFNTTHKARGFVPTVREPYLDLVKDNTWWSIQYKDWQFNTKEEYQQAIDTYFETFQYTADAEDDGTSFETVLLPYLPIFSNCRGWDSYIVFHELVESKQDCYLPGQQGQGHDYIPSCAEPGGPGCCGPGGDPERAAGCAFPERYAFPAQVPQDDLYVASDYRVRAIPTADWCERRISCSYEENLPQQEAVPRWFEVDEGDLWLIMRMPVSYIEFTGRPQERITIEPVNLDDPDRPPKPYNDGGWNDAGGQNIVVKNAAVYGSDYFIPVGANGEAGADICSEAEEAGLGELFIPHYMVLDIAYYQLNQTTKRIVMAQLVYDDYTTVIPARPDRQRLRVHARRDVLPARLGDAHHQFRVRRRHLLRAVLCDWLSERRRVRLLLAPHPLDDGARESPRACGCGGCSR